MPWMITKHDELEEPPYMEAHVYFLLAFSERFFKKSAYILLKTYLFQIVVVPDKLPRGKFDHKIPDNYCFTAQMV